MAAPWKALPSVAHQSMLIILALLSLPVSESVSLMRSKRQNTENYFYTSVCENSTMDLRCPPGLVIYIDSANFGRSDNITCVANSPVITDTCYSDNALEIMSLRCDQQLYCSVETTSEIFGDPCPGVAKYFEVLFECKPPPTTIGPPTTTTLPTTPSPTTTTSPTTTAQNPSTTKLLSPSGSATVGTELPVDATTILPDFDTTTKLQTTTKLPTTTTKAPTTTKTTTAAGTTVATTTYKPSYCMPVEVRGVLWEHPPEGTINRQPCPEGHTGYATWHCLGHPASWTPASGPDLSECVSIKIQNITDQLAQGVSVTTISEDLVATVEQEEELYGGDLLEVTNILTVSLGSLDQELENATAKEKAVKTQEVTKNYLKVGSTILNDNNLDSWGDLKEETQTETASTLITSLEESGFLLADTMGEDDSVVEEEDNIVMEVIVRGEDEDGDLVFPDPNQLSGDWKGITDSITLPADSIRNKTKDGKTKIVLLAYNNIGQFLGKEPGPPGQLVNRTQPSSPTAQPQHDAHPCSPKTEYEASRGDVVNSRVLSVSINDPRESTALSKPVNLTFEHHLTGDNLTDAVCSFWKFDNNSGDFMSGEWSDRGCRLVLNNETHTVCSCDHLTNFAVIMNVRGLPIPPSHSAALSAITYIGFIISIPCLICALITFCMFKNLQSDRTTIHKNLCLCLICAEIIFACGIAQTANQTACAVVAMLLHYFFLSAFAWMCLEGIQLYIMLVEVFEAESSRRKYYYPFGYILPLVIVGISAAVDFGSYGTADYCWICLESNLKWAFFGPIVLIILGNILFLSMALFIMCKHSTIQTNPKEKTPKEKATDEESLDYEIENSNSLTSLGTTRGQYFKSLVRGAMVLLCLLGVTWMFGLLYITEDFLVFTYIFTITNSLQGLFIYIFHCCMNDKVRKEYRRYVRNSRWLPECIRERYGAIMLTNSNQQNSYRSSSGMKRPDSKRFSNTTGSYNVDHRKMSNSSVMRNSEQYEPVKFSSEMTVPEEEEHIDFGVHRQHMADEGIGLDFEDHPVHESTRIDAAEGSEPHDNAINNRLSAITTEFQPLIADVECDSQRHAKLVNVRQPEEKTPSPVELHPLIRESGIGGSRSNSSCSEDFTPASPTSHDVLHRAHVFANCGTFGMTGSMPDLINPLTAHARKARMDLVPDAYNNPTNVVEVAATSNVSKGYHTLPSPAHTGTGSPSKSDYSRLQSDKSHTSPWYKRASRADDVDEELEAIPKKQNISLSTPTSPASTKSKSLLETMI